jgi:hypothetical protein
MLVGVLVFEKTVVPESLQFLDELLDTLILMTMQLRVNGLKGDEWFGERTGKGTASLARLIFEEELHRRSDSAIGWLNHQLKCLLTLDVNQRRYPANAHVIFITQMIDTRVWILNAWQQEQERTSERYIQPCPLDP